jgi:hypothetical protein
MLHSTDVLESAHRRMVDAHPDGRATIDRWFDTHRNRLLPLATALVKQSARSPERFTASTDQGERVVAELLDRLHALPDLQAWAHKYAEILKLLVRSIVGSLGQAQEIAEPPASTGPLPTDWPRTAGERLAANVTAIRIVASGRTPTEAERGALLRYTGNGGLSLERLAEQVPAEWIPDSKALVDEYYMLPFLAAALASLLVAIFPVSSLSGPALEPSAGVGRVLGAFAARPEMAGLSWFAVEYSRLSAEICRLLYPFAQVFNQPFEQWIFDKYNQIAGTLALVVTNPPYGKRGANKTIDPDKDYREEIAYLYFIRRAFDLLRPGGVGIALVPGGFLTNPTGPVARARERVLLRHHLLCAYRLPSAIFPGANLITDVSIWRSRGGKLSAILPEDEAIARGQYYAFNPQAILGTQTSKPGRYGRSEEIIGDFTGFPYPVLREECSSCSVQPYLRPIKAIVHPEDSLRPELQLANALGKRVERYSSLIAAAKESTLALAVGLHHELVLSVSDWHLSRRDLLGEFRPRHDRELLGAANKVPGIAALLGVFDDSGLTAAFLTPPAYTPSYHGPSTIAAHAEWLYSKHRRLTLSALHQFRLELGNGETVDDLEQALVAQDWCEDWPEGMDAEWLPAPDYYSGELTPRLSRARATGGQRAVAQTAKLIELIGTPTIEDAAPTIRAAWLPTEVTQAFLAQRLRIEVPELHWFRALLKPVGVDYSELGKLDESLQTAIGFINHDLTWFHPAYTKQTDPASGVEETAEAALDRARVEYVTSVNSAFLQWLPTTQYQEQILTAYKRIFLGYRQPQYPQKPLPIARWGSKIKLKPHQEAGAWRLIRNNGGLSAFDVGVGKTLTGIATMAYLREIGRARRPLIIVPNTIVWKWHREILRALPDYRVVVIGSVRYLGRNGIYQSRLDERAERLAKWTEFKLGLYDCALCTFSVFAATGITEDSLRLMVEETPSLLRQVGIKGAKLASDIEKLDELYEKRSELASKLTALRAELEGAVPGTPSDDDGEDEDLEDGD